MPRPLAPVLPRPSPCPPSCTARVACRQVDPDPEQGGSTPAPAAPSVPLPGKKSYGAKHARRTHTRTYDASMLHAHSARSRGHPPVLVERSVDGSVEGAAHGDGGRLVAALLTAGGDGGSKDGLRGERGGRATGKGEGTARRAGGTAGCVVLVQRAYWAALQEQQHSSRDGPNPAPALTGRPFGIGWVFLLFGCSAPKPFAPGSACSGGVRKGGLPAPPAPTDQPSQPTPERAKQTPPYSWSDEPGSCFCSTVHAKPA